MPRQSNVLWILVFIVAMYAASMATIAIVTEKMQHSKIFASEQFENNPAVLCLILVILPIAIGIAILTTTSKSGKINC